MDEIEKSIKHFCLVVMLCTIGVTYECLKYGVSFGDFAYFALLGFLIYLLYKLEQE